MSDSVIVTLVRFTPESMPGRDELLFRAGRASAPSRRGWIALAGLLAVSHLVMVTFWFCEARQVVPVVPEYRIPVAPVMPFLPSLTDPDSYAALMATWDGDTFSPTRIAVEPNPASPILTVRTAWSDRNLD